MVGPPRPEIVETKTPLEREEQEPLQEISPEELTEQSPIDQEPSAAFVGPMPLDKLPSAAQLIEDEITQIKPPAPRRPLRMLFLLLFSLILISTIALQLIYFNRVELAKDPKLRPLLEQACELINPHLPAGYSCNIPLQQNAEAFTVIDRDIRSHSSESGALSVQLQLSNDAPFTQPYPLLHLQFRNLNDEIIGQRLFTPQQYLKEKSHIDKGIASKAKVQAVFDIVDPGSEASNFIFNFYHH